MVQPQCRFKKHSVSIQLMLTLAMHVSVVQGEIGSTKPAANHYNRDGSEDNHVDMVRAVSQKGKLASQVWKVEQDILAARDMCIMNRPGTVPSTRHRLPRKDDWVRPQKVPKGQSIICLPLRFKKYEEMVDDKCEWAMNAGDKVQVVTTDGIGNFILANPGNGRQSLMTPWEKWRYDDSVLDGMKTEVIDLKTDCEKTMFSLYSVQTAVKDTYHLLNEAQLVNQKGDELRRSQTQLRTLQEHLKVAHERLQEVHDLKESYDRVCR
jgi:hypothetical protein